MKEISNFRAALLASALGFVIFTQGGCAEKDATAPAAPLVETVESASCDADPIVTGTAEFGATVRIAGGSSVVEATADPYTARFSATVPGGAGQELSVTAVDAAGNESDATVVDVQVLSGQPEIVDLSLSENMVEAGATVTYETTVMDGCGNVLDVPVSVFTNAPGAIAADGTLSGLVRSGSFSVVAEVPGTSAVDSETLVVDPDESTTIVVLQLNALSAFVNVPLGFTVTAVDGFGNPVDQAGLQITSSDDGNGATVDLVAQTITFATEGNPSHSVTATLFGGTANEVSDTESVLVSDPDLAAPTVDIISPAGGLLLADRDVVVTVQVSDDQGLAQVFLQATGVENDFQQQLIANNPGTGQPEVGPLNLDFTIRVGNGEVGDLTLVAQALDIAGNLTSSIPVTVTIDPARQLVFDTNRFDARTISARGFIDAPRGISYDPLVDRLYVANRNTDPVSVVEIDPAGDVLGNQNAFVLNQGVDGEDIELFDDGLGNRFHFLSTAGGADRVLRISARTAVGVGGGATESFSANNGNASRGITVESASSIAVLFDDGVVRRYNPLEDSGNLPVGALSSVDASNILGDAWGIDLLGLGCEADTFPCADGTQCIPLGNVCAGDGNQCNDGSDESNCNGANWICADGTTEIDPALICDGDIDCPAAGDFDDEARCTHYAAADNGANDEAFRFYDNGNGNQSANVSLLADQPPLQRPTGVAVSPNTGFIYIASRDSDNLVRVNPVTLAREVIMAGFARAYDLEFDNNGDLLVSDESRDLIYRITAVGTEIL